MNHQANTGGPQRACVADATVSLPAGKQLSIDIRWAGSRITNPDHLPKHPKSCLFQREIPISLLFLHNFTQKIPIFFCFPSWIIHRDGFSSQKSVQLLMSFPSPAIITFCRYSEVLIPNLSRFQSSLLQTPLRGELPKTICYVLNPMP